MKARNEGIFEMVKNFLMVGTPLELVIKASGWTEQEIRKAFPGMVLPTA